MDVLLTVFFSLAVLTLFTIVSQLGFIAYVIYRKENPVVWEDVPQDVPEKKVNNTLPIEQFKPDPKRKLTYKIIDEGDQTILEENNDA